MNKKQQNTYRQFIAASLGELHDQRQQQYRKQRKAREQVMRDLGLVRVKGSLGGTYWE